MRFEEIQEFNIDDLLLDKDNYRFTKAEDQRACVKKIYDINPTYFKGLMKSVAEDDLGEPLLVYANENGESIVADGNRRLSVSKVLHDDNYAPTETIKAYAQELREANTINFSNIQAQVSPNQELVAKTVHERHSGGKNGTRRIPWNAYAAARFGFDKGIGDHKEWRIMALLSKTEEEYPEIEVNRGNFSYDIFRRIVRGALSQQKISENIFSERGERIKKTARSDLIKDAISKSLKFIKAIQNRELTLSRKDGEAYADKETVDAYLEQFSLSPDNAELERSKEAANQNNDEQKASSLDQAHKESGQSNSSNNNQAPHYAESNNNSDNSNDEDDAEIGNHKILESSSILERLKKLKSKKLIGLYYSLCKISLNKHPALMYVGAWSFFEVLSKFIGNNNDEFPGFYKSKSKNFGFDKNKVKDFGTALTEISNYGNATKHSQYATPISANQLSNHFEVLEPLILAVLDQAISDKNKETT